MIRFFDEKDRFSVISIWQEAFGDDKEDISIFLEFSKDDILVFEQDGKVVSMLTLLKVHIGKDNGRYIYAVATEKEFRKRGYASALIKYAKCFIVKNNEKFLVLLPQEESLYNFYKKYGFCELSCAEKIRTKIDLNETTNIKAEIVTPEEYLLFRKSYFLNERFVEWDIKALKFMKRAYNGNFFVLRNANKPCCAAFCYYKGDSLIAAELLSLGDRLKHIKALGIFCKISKIVCICASKYEGKFAMIYPSKYSDSYFGLGMK